MIESVQKAARETRDHCKFFAQQWPFAFFKDTAFGPFPVTKKFLRPFCARALFSSAEPFSSLSAASPVPTAVLNAHSERARVKNRVFSRLFQLFSWMSVVLPAVSGIQQSFPTPVLLVVVACCLCIFWPKRHALGSKQEEKK